MDEVFLGTSRDPRTYHQHADPADTSAASRYFAAAAYHDGAFRRRVLEFARHGWYRARAPEFGIEEALVVAHCRRAAKREHVRDALMLLVFLVMAYKPIVLMLKYPDFLDEILSEYGSNLVAGVLLASGVLFLERLLTEHFILTRQFARTMRPEQTRPPGAIAEKPQNLVIYGAYSPFVGSGHNLDGWSFSVNLERTCNGEGAAKEVSSFTGEDLLRFVEDRLDRLRMDGVRHYQALFADGRLVRDNARQFFDGSQLRRYLDDSTIEQMSDSPGAGTRSYLCINIVDWSGEIVLSSYLRCKKGESNLFVEAAYFLLTPPKRSFFRIDEMDAKLRLGTLFRILSRSVVTSAFILIAAVFRLLALVQSPIAHWQERRKIRGSMRKNPRFNFGAITSIRELGMENYYRVYFQQLDKERHVKTVEQCTIDAIVEFLDNHDIDTSDIRDRRSAILNNGVIVSGGNLSAENMSVGANAKAILSRLGTKPAGERSNPPPSAKASSAR